MSQNFRNLCWAGALIALALANWAGLVADRDANLLFVLMPALWLATAGSTCRGTGAMA